MLKVKNFFKNLNSLDVIGVFLILMAMILLVIDQNFKNTISSWFFILLIFLNQIFMINQCQKTRKNAELIDAK